MRSVFYFIRLICDPLLYTAPHYRPKFCDLVANFVHAILLIYRFQADMCEILIIVLTGLIILGSFLAAVDFIFNNFYSIVIFTLPVFILIAVIFYPPLTTYFWFWIKDVAEVVFEYALIPWNFLFQPSYEDEFLPCEKHDAVLVIGKRKIHVNKAVSCLAICFCTCNFKFLSYHSDYFRALFSSSFKENEQNEIELKDVVYGDFELLMSTIYPKPVFPTGML